MDVDLICYTIIEALCVGVGLMFALRYEGRYMGIIRYMMEYILDTIEVDCGVLMRGGIDAYLATTYLGYCDDD